MKKNAFLAVILAAVFAVSIVAPAMAVERISPNKNHSGNIGTSTRIWQYGYFDNLVGDSTNAYINGFRQKINAVTTSTSVALAKCGQIYSNKGASKTVQLDLPDVSTVSGCTFGIMVSVASSVYVNPYGQDYIKVMTNAAGDAITNAASGSFIMLISDGSQWFPHGTAYGSWVDTN